MKTSIKLFFVLTAAAYFGSAKAQADQKALPDFGSEIRNTTLSVVQDLDLTNKILFINIWRSDDQTSRDNNIEFLRVSNIYTQARLKNGKAGVVFINICIDPQLYTWVMSIKKDETASKYSLENSAEKYNSLVKYFDGKPGSMVIGSDGTTLAKDIKKEDCFPLFRSFITR
jgi:hypothetical protein